MSVPTQQGQPDNERLCDCGNLDGLQALGAERDGLVVERDRYRLAISGLANLVRVDNPAGRSLVEIARTWGEGVTAEEIEALVALGDGEG